MTTITEDYVSFEIAKLLREKGFAEKCRTYYKVFPENRIAAIYHSSENRGISEDDPNEILCPTLQMAIKWLLKKHNICIVSLPVVTDDEGEGGCLWNYIISKKLKTLHTSDGLYESSEFALSNGLKYALENLI